MASTYEAGLRFEQIADGEKNNTWGAIERTNKELISEAIRGMETISLSTATDYTLTSLNGATDEARNAILKFTGTPTANINVVIPSVSKTYAVWNATGGGFTVSMKTSSGTAVLLPRNVKLFLFCDGTDVHILSYSDVLRQGKHTIAAPAPSWLPTITSGCAAATQVEVSAGGPNIVAMDFDASTAEYAQFTAAMPKSWNGSTVTYRVFWTANSTSSNSVVWALQGVSIGDGDAVDSTYGTAVTVTDANASAAYRENVTSESGPVTIGGSPAGNELVTFRLYRDAANAADTLTVDARLLHVHIYPTLNAANDE